MGHTIHLFSPETWGFHIDLVTEDNVVAPLSMKDSSHSLDPSQNSSLMYDAFRFIFPFFFYMIAQIFLLLSSCWGSPLWLFPACFFFLFFLSNYVFPTCFFETSLFIIRPQIISNFLIKNCSADQGISHIHMYCCVAVPETLSSVFLCWPAIIGLWFNVRCWASWVQICSITYSI